VAAVWKGTSATACGGFFGPLASVEDAPKQAINAAIQMRDHVAAL
jgi:hypothetical protein